MLKEIPRQNPTNSHTTKSGQQKIFAFWAHLSRSDKSFCDTVLYVFHRPSSVCACVYLFIQTPSLQIPPGKICPNIAGMFLAWNFFKLFKEWNSMQNSGCLGKRKILVFNLRVTSEEDLMYHNWVQTKSPWR